MKKIIRPCLTPEYGGKFEPVFCKIELSDDGRLSITGVVGPRHGGNCAGGAGQIDGGFAHRNPAHDDKRYPPIKASKLTFAPGWDREKWYTFLEIWHLWHLNDMRAACEHMTGAAWDTSKELILSPLRPGPEYHQTRQAAKNGKLDADQYKQWSQDVTAADAVWLHSKPSHPDLWNLSTRALMKRGYLVIDKPETKNAGWVYPTQHPEGLLTKPCPTCGYKYGSAWRKVEVPADVIAFLQSLPDTDITPAWV